MKQYLELLEDLMDNGITSGDRTGVGTLRKAGHMMRFDLSKGFPLVTTKKVHVKSVIHELLFFLSGSTNIKYLQDNGVTIWDEWADTNGELGPVYGAQWRSWPSATGPIDQIKVAMELLVSNPNDRGILVSAWNPPQLPMMALRPCHCLFQLLVVDGKLSLEIYQRSCDSYIGLIFNLASYALLTHMFAQQAGLEVGDLIWVGGDVHLYLNHLEQAQEQVQREPRPLPKLVIKHKPESIFDYKYEDFEIVGYNPHPHIKAEVAV